MKYGYNIGLKQPHPALQFQLLLFVQSTCWYLDMSESMVYP